MSWTEDQDCTAVENGNEAENASMTQNLLANQNLAMIQNGRRDLHGVAAAQELAANVVILRRTNETDHATAVEFPLVNICS